MGKKTTYFCDLCGAEVTDKRDLHMVNLPALQDDGYGNEMVRSHTMDVCDSCRTAYEALIINDFAEIHVDAYGFMKPSPVRKPGVSDTLAELRTEHAAEVLELEEELERLRDVKDQLFETNFKLTARLRANGIEVDDV